jgi:hypothetical protein
MRAGLPLNRLTSFGEVVALPNDQPVKVDTAQPDVARADDETTEVPHHSQERCVPFTSHSGREYRGHSSHLCVIRGQQSVDGVGHGIEST